MGEIWRGGASTSHTSQEKQSVRVGAQYVSIPKRPSIYSGGRFDGDSKKGVAVIGIIASKGGGETSVKLWLDESDFLALAESMVKAAPEEAKRAFASAIENPNASHEKSMREYHERELAKLRGEAG